MIAFFGSSKKQRSEFHPSWLRSCVTDSTPVLTAEAGSSNDPALALHLIPATPKRCKDSKEVKERLTAWSLRVAEDEHDNDHADSETDTTMPDDDDDHDIASLASQPSVSGQTSSL